jgi:hypothetical protein
VYGIAASGEYPREELVEATVNLASESLPQPALGDGRYGVGFVTVHEAATLDIALVYWWQSQNELHQRVFAGPRADPPAMSALEHQATGCVWELGVIDFERRAWFEDVLTNPDGPRPRPLPLPRARYRVLKPRRRASARRSATPASVLHAPNDDRVTRPPAVIRAKSGGWMPRERRRDIGHTPTHAVLVKLKG